MAIPADCANAALVSSPRADQAQEHHRITQAAWRDGVVTLTTATPHGLSPGLSLNVSDMAPPKYNGAYVAAEGTAGTVVRFAKRKDPGAATSFGTVQLLKRRPRRRRIQLLPTDPHVECRLRIGDVIAITGCSRSHWYDLVARGLAPRPERLPHTRVSVWRSGAIAAFLGGHHAI